jgi:hypothetical protein
MEDHDHTEEHVEDNALESFPHSRVCIFEGNWQEHVPAGFDAVVISLDGRVQADLDWKKGREQAQIAIEKGYALMWDMQLGLFQGLGQPLTNQTQFLSLTLSLEHFRDTLWKEFKSHTVGLSIFRGSVDFSQGFPWDSHQQQNLKEWLQELSDPRLASLDFAQLQQEVEGQQLIRLFCRDVAVEYLSLLATRLPDSLSTYLYLDATALNGPLLHEIQLLNPERFDRLLLGLKGHRLPFEAYGWKVPTPHGYMGSAPAELPSLPSASIGVCVPSMSFYQAHHYEGLEEGLAALQKRALPFKLIAESQLTSQWDGLDYLLYTPSGLSTQGKRKLQGFCAAGGTAVSTGALLGLPYEMSLADWLKTI